MAETMDRGESPGRATINASGIARMAGVGRAAVSNWRRRYADFPHPVAGTPTNPAFDAAAVEQWLESQGRLAPVSAIDLVWRRIESFAPATRIGDALGAVGAYLLVESWQTADKDKAQAPAGRKVRLPTPKQLLNSLRTRHHNLAEVAAAVLPPAWSPEFADLLHAAAALRHEQDAFTAFEYLHGKYVTSPRSMSGPAAEPGSVTEIMLTFVGDGGTVFDFSTGTGSLLYAMAKRAYDTGASIACIGQELQARYALIALLRLWFLHDRAAASRQAAHAPIIQVGDSLLSDGFPDARADAVVSSPPFGIHDWGHERLAFDPRWTFGLPPRTEPELAWVQHALYHLRPGGLAVLLMPPAAASRPAGRRIRGELVRQGALRAVVALPAGMLPPVAIGFHLWVLQRPDPRGSRSELLFVDSSTAGSPTLTRQVVEKAWHAYRSADADADADANGDGDAHAGWHRVVTAMQVLDGEIDLSPRRHVRPPTSPEHDPHRTVANARSFKALAAEAQSLIPAVRPTRQASKADVPSISVADLARAGSLSIHRSASRLRTEGVGSGQASQGMVLTVEDVLKGGPPSALTNSPREEGVAVRVEVDDILIPSAGREVMARVATPDQVGAELGPGLYAIRVKADLLDPWFVAGVLSRSDNVRLAGRTSTTSAGMLRFEMNRLTIAVLSIDKQREYGEAFRQLAQFRITLQRILEDGSELARDIVDGLAAGTLITSAH